MSEHALLRDYSKIFFNLIKSDKRLLSVVIIYGVVASLFNIVLPLSIQYIASQIVANASVFPIFIIVVCLFFFLVFYAVLKIFQLIAFSYFEKAFFINKAYMFIISSFKHHKKIDDHQLILSYGEIFNTIQYVSNFIFTTSVLIQQFTIGLIFTAFYHFSFLIFNIIIFVIVFVIFRFYFLRSVVFYKKELNSRYNIAKFIGSDYSDPSTNQAIKQSLVEYYKRKTDYFNIILNQNVIFFILYIFANSTFLLTSGILTLKGYITIPQFLASEIIFSLVFATFGEFTKNLKNIYELLTSSKKMDGIIDIKGYDFDNNPQPPKFQRFPKFYRTLIKSLIIFVFVAIVGLFNTPWYQTSQGNGKIIAYNQDERAQVLTAMVSGRIIKWYARDGEFLKAGAKIAEIADNDPDLMLKLESEYDSIKSQFRNAQLSSQASKLNYDRQYELYNKGLTARKDFEKASIEYQKNLGYENELKAKLIQADVKLARQKSQIIVAPRDGYLLSSTSKSSSSYVYPGESIATFVPQITNPTIELFVHPNDMPLIHHGQKVRIQIEGWPALRISGWPSTSLGTFGGIVSVVDNAISENGMFRVFVIPDQSDSPWPDMKYIKQGTKTMAWIRMGKVSIGYEIWRKMNQFPITPDQKLLLKNEKK